MAPSPKRQTTLKTTKSPHKPTPNIPSRKPSTKATKQPLPLPALTRSPHKPKPKHKIHAPKRPKTTHRSTTSPTYWPQWDVVSSGKPPQSQIPISEQSVWSEASPADDLTAFKQDWCYVDFLDSWGYIPMILKEAEFRMVLWWRRGEQGVVEGEGVGPKETDAEGEI